MKSKFLVRFYSLSLFFYSLSLFFLGLLNSLSAQDCCIVDCSPSYAPNEFNMGIEWLYWRVKEEHLRGGSFVDDFPNPTLKIANGSVIQPKGEFSNGIRGHIGYTFFCDRWELNGIYTYIPLDSKSDFREVIPLDLQTETHRQFIIPNTNDFPSFQAFGSNGLTAFTSLLTKWNGHLSYADIDLAYKLSFDDSFHLRPHFGFRAAWMKQHLLMKGGLQQPSTNNSTFGSLKFKESFNGYGIEGGIWADWELGSGFAIIGHVGGSILYSRFKVDILSESSVDEGGTVVFIINSGGKEITAVPIIDYFTGLKYDMSFDNFLISAHLGWEQKIFFNMNQMSANLGNLSLQGLTIGLNLGF